MFIEILSLFSILLGGYFLVRSTSMRGWAVIPTGFLSGINLLIIFGSLNIISGIKSNPIPMHVLTLGVPLLIWFLMYRKGRDVQIEWVHLILSLFFIVCLTVFFHKVNLVKWSPDSFQYLMIGNLFANGNFTAVTPDLLTTRMLSVPLINAIANFGSDIFLPSILPLISLSTGLLLIWFITADSKKNKNQILVIILSMLLLYSNNRYIFHSFYINGHLLVSYMLLMLCGINWLFIRNSSIPKNTLFILEVITIPAIILTRPDGSILAGIALIPMLFSGDFPLSYKRKILFTYGVSILIWQGYLVGAFLQGGINVPIQVSGLLILGLLSIIAIYIINKVSFEKISALLVWLTEIGLWLALSVFTIINPDIFLKSFEATKENILDGSGGWGSSIINLGIVVIILLILTRFHGKTLLRFSITTFFPVSFILAYLREGVYRVGLGDSLNRSFMHIVPLSILFIAVSINSGQFRISEIINRTIKLVDKIFKSTNQKIDDEIIN